MVKAVVIFIKITTESLNKVPNIFLIKYVNQLLESEKVGVSLQN